MGRNLALASDCITSEVQCKELIECAVDGHACLEFPEFMSSRENNWTGDTKRRRLRPLLGGSTAVAVARRCSLSDDALRKEMNGRMSPRLISGRRRGGVFSSLEFSLPVLILLLLSSLANAQNVTGNATLAPSAAPTVSPQTGSPTLRPTLFTTVQPTLRPSIARAVPTMRPSDVPSTVPSLNPTGEPSAPPSISSVPTSSVAPSYMPSSVPTDAPSVSDPPSLVPTDFPSDQPSSIPSYLPSSLPTFVSMLEIRQLFRQDIIVPFNFTFFNSTEQERIMTLYASYTEEYGEYTTPVVNTSCQFGNQDSNEGDGETKRLTMDFTCIWNSKTVTLGEFPDKFQAYVNSNLTDVTDDLKALQLNVIEAKAVEKRITVTPAPTGTPNPSAAPSPRPSNSLRPSIPPSAFPSFVPTPFVEPSAAPSTPLPTESPSTLVPTRSPTPAPTPPTSDDDLPLGLISGVVIGVGMAGLAVLAIFYVRSTKNRSARAAEVVAEEDEEEEPKVSTGYVTGVKGSDMSPDLGLSPSESILSNKSLLSAGESGLGGESGDELDGTKNLQDEFDQYKDQSLEQFRSNVEGNITGFEGVMSAAVTKALIGDDDVNVDPNDLLWGCDPDPDGTEIEASALCEVNDWLKRNEPVAVERKRQFMKEILSRMVTTVRFGQLKAEDASRTVHESAALLGLPLANELPMTTVIVSGMRKTITATQMVNVLREFGDIDVAAVASGARGFGIIRYRNTKSVDRALHRYRGGEIVVQDVAIQMKVLRPSGAVET